MARLSRPDVSERSLGVLAVSLTTLVWGLVPIILKQTHMPPVAFAMYRLWMGVLVYALVLVVTGRRLRWATIKACALGGVLFGVDIALTFSAFKLASVANATIIGGLAPVFIALGAARWFGERLERRDLVFVALSFLGVGIVAVGSAGSPSWSPLGDAFAAASTLSWTAYWLFSKRARRSVSALEYMATVMLVGAVTVTCVAVALGLSGHISLAPPHGSDWLWIWVVTLLAGAMGHTLLAWSHRHLEAWLASLITQCMPVVGSVAAWVLLGESLTALTIAGGMLVLGATAVIAVRETRRASGAVLDPPVPPPAG
jgi:drug/metabolite transporter (DMT)-like permease